MSGGFMSDADFNRAIFEGSMPLPEESDAARDERAATCPGCGSTNTRAGIGHVLPSCYSCGLAWDTMDDGEDE